MPTAVTTALRSILMEDGRVCLPGIGTLVAVEQPAVLSLIEGKAMPPSARISFNANLVLDDGRLSRELHHHEEEAARFLQQTRDTLAAGHPVVLDGIGKLYKHHDGEIRFTAGAGNFSKESFGLPAISVQPILRKEKLPASTAPAKASKTRPGRSARPRSGPRLSDLQRRRLWYAAGLAGILVAIFLLFRIAGSIGTLFGGDAGARDKAEIPRERLNVSPRETPAPAPPTVVDAETVQPGPAPRLNESPATENPSTPGPGADTENVAIIAIGLFSRQRNVDKQTGRLTEAGYEPYTDREGRNTRVGVTIRYKEIAELRTALTAIRERYTEDAFVMRVNGEEQAPR